MTSNLASEEIADHGLQLRQEAEEVSKKRKSGSLGTLYSEESDMRNIQMNIFLISPCKNMLWILIRSASLRHF